MKFLLGTKEYMTQVWNDEGEVVPTTAVSVTPATVVQVKTEDKDGYKAVQLGSGERKKKNVSKAFQGHASKAQKSSGKEKGTTFRFLREFPLTGGEDDSVSVGDTIDLSVFEIGDSVSVTSISKGKGYQGVVKRHGFAGGPKTHGQKHSHREGGSIGATGPQRVMKNKRMPGRTGGETITVKNLSVVKIDPENNLLFIKGAIPGRKGTLVEIHGEQA